MEHLGSENTLTPIGGGESGGAAFRIRELNFLAPTRRVSGLLVASYLDPRAFIFCECC